MNEIRIQRAFAPNWQSVRDVRLRSLADTPNAFATTLAEDEARLDADWIARVENADVAHFLATISGGDPVGIAVGAPYKGKENTAGLFAMWVAPERRGQGVGGALVEAVVSWARIADYGRIILDVADDNMAAIRLYESCGFVPTGNTCTLPPPRQHITEHERSLKL